MHWRDRYTGVGGGRARYALPFQASGVAGVFLGPKYKQNENTHPQEIKKYTPSDTWMERGGKRECDAKDPKETDSKGTKQGGRQGTWGVPSRYILLPKKIFFVPKVPTFRDFFEECTKKTACHKKEARYILL